MSYNARFCFICGKKTVLRYPGNDPENGPASQRCTDDTHPSILDVADEFYSEKLSDPKKLMSELIDTIDTDYSWPDPLGKVGPAITNVESLGEQFIKAVTALDAASKQAEEAYVAVEPPMATAEEDLEY